MTDKMDLQKLHADIERLTRGLLYSCSSEYISLCRRAVRQETMDAIDIVIAMAANRGSLHISDTLSLMFQEASRADNDSVMNYLINFMTKPLPITLLLRAVKDERKKAVGLLLPHYTKEAIFDELTVLAFHDNPDIDAFEFFYEHSNKEDIVKFYEGLKKDPEQFGDVYGVTLFLERAKVDYEYSVLQNFTDKIIEKKEQSETGDETNLSTPRKTRGRRSAL